MMASDESHRRLYSSKLCIILLDRSYSMEGTRMNTAKKYINSLPFEEFKIFPFTSTLERTISKSQLPSLEVHNGTDIVTALRSMFEILLGMKRNIYLILLTDAEDWCSHTDVHELVSLRDKVQNRLKKFDFKFVRNLKLIDAGSMKADLEVIFGTTVSVINDNNIKQALEKSAKIEKLTYELETQTEKVKKEIKNISPIQEESKKQIENIHKQVKEINNKQEIIDKQIESMKGDLTRVNDELKEKDIQL